MSHKTVIDKKELFAVSFPGLVGTTDESPDVYQTSFAIYIDELCIYRFPENIDNSLAKPGSRKIVYCCAVIG